MTSALYTSSTVAWITEWLSHFALSWLLLLVYSLWGTLHCSYDTTFLSLKMHENMSEMLQASHVYSSWLDHPNKICFGVLTIKLLIMQFFLHPCYLILLRPKYLSQYPFLKHTQPMFLPQCERPSFTSIQNNRKQSSVNDKIQYFIYNQPQTKVTMKRCRNSSIFFFTMLIVGTYC